MVLVQNPALRVKWKEAADIAAVAVIASLPWSTSATSILLAVWLVLLLPLLDWHEILAETKRLRSLLAIALLLFACLAVLWSVGSAKDRVHSLASFVKLAAIPLVIMHAAMSPRLGRMGLRAFLSSLIVLLLLSFATLTLGTQPSPLFPMLAPGVPVKDWIAQTFFFELAAFCVAHLAANAFESGRRSVFLLYAALGLAFIVNLMMIHPSRTGLAVIPVLILLFMVQRCGWVRGLAGGFALALAGGLLMWSLSPMVRERIFAAVHEVEQYETSGETTSAGYRLEWYSQSSRLLSASPLLGYGTGSVRPVLEKEAEQGRLPPQFVTSNPHNQMLSVAMQTGLVGLLLLLGLWGVHAVGLCGADLAARLGLGLLAQNVFGGLLNSYLSDFTQGWTYVLGIGIMLAVAAKPQTANASKP